MKTKKEREREYRHETDGDRHQPVGIDADGAPIARAPDINPTKTVERRPEGALKLLKLIINHSLEARTIPETEKYNTVTGLPKGEGQVTSTAKMRPISVGPVIGKIINKLIAYRLARSLIASDSMDKAQFAFLPGLSIHEAINSVLACFKQSTKAKPNTAEKACYAAFYDISKAYDTIRWSSIERALRQKGAPRELIDFVMNSLEGTTLTMKTNSHGGRTRAVKVHQAIKQGCPLAPLLFVIVMDELHRGYRTIGGYKLATGEVVASRGYCDDTVILASDMRTLRLMNQWTHKFFKTHCLGLNMKKSVVMGRHKDGTPLRTGMIWPETMTNMALAAPGEAVRYLGLYMNMDGTWDTQVGKMNALIMTVVTAIRHGRLTVLQAGILIREVIAAKLEIGLRHANIPKNTIQEWDKWLSGAMNTSLGRGSIRTHSSMVMSSLSTLTLENASLVAATVQLLESITKRYELRTHYQTTLAIAADPNAQNRDKQTVNLLTALQARGIAIEVNPAGNAIEDALLEEYDPGGYHVEYIAAHRQRGRKNNTRECLVYWLGYDTPTWEIRSTLKSFAHMAVA